MNVKYYSMDETINMLPLIKGYCRDIKECFQRVEVLLNRNRKLSNLTSMNDVKKEKINKLKNYIREKINIHCERFNRWRDELKELFITVCSAQFGRVDVPVYCASTECVVLFCVTPDTSTDTIEWHVDGEGHEQARLYFEKIV